MFQDWSLISTPHRSTNMSMWLLCWTPYCLKTMFKVLHLAHWDPLCSDPWPFLWFFSLFTWCSLPPTFSLQKHHLTFSYRTVTPYRTSAIPSVLTASSHPDFSPHFFWLEPGSHSLNSYSLYRLLLPQSFPGSLSCRLLSLITWAY